MIRKMIVLDLDTDWRNILPPGVKVYTDPGGHVLMANSRVTHIQVTHIQALVEGTPPEVAEVLMMYNESTYTSLRPFTVIPR